jgi:hypothetical protein
MNRMLSFESHTPDPTVPGKVTFNNVTLIVSMFPYKRGTHFDKIVFDPVNFVFTAYRKNKQTTHRVQLTLHSSR